MGAPLSVAVGGASLDEFSTCLERLEMLPLIAVEEKIGLFGGAGVGKTILVMELINNIAKLMGTYPYFAEWVNVPKVSALLGRMPSAVGYQPTLSTEMVFQLLHSEIGYQCHALCAHTGTYMPCAYALGEAGRSQRTRGSLQKICHPALTLESGKKSAHRRKCKCVSTQSKPGKSSISTPMWQTWNQQRKVDA
ncbi:hypothetical protein M9H77_33665 [Catharanthus roseus]|uniref:Uncharacterized protein n=1 Tax=Catharanthus roseus TaxID=4058 RepID=A0ACB9ZJB7_CATRO|nr:hypothetical protein M9H77_33665 [Catharanthus roseus]